MTDDAKRYVPPRRRTPAEHDAIWARWHAEAVLTRASWLRAEEAALAAQQAATAAYRRER